MIEDGSFKMVEDGVLELINLYTKTETEDPPRRIPLALSSDSIILYGY